MPNKLLSFLLACVAIIVAQAQSLAPDAVLVPATGDSHSPETLQALVFRPQGKGPHPAVVMVHGCGGAFGKDGALNARHAMWGDYLASQGYVALMLDSFSTRGIKEICTTPYRQRTIRESDRVGDAYAALAYLRQMPGVDADRIALLGWSHGGGVTLDAIISPPKAGAGFSAAVSFYPGCTSRAKKADRFHPYAPLLLLMGEADDWTPAAPCKALAAEVVSRGEPMQIVTYADTFHDFDNPALKARILRRDVPNGVNPGAGVTIAPNPVAREDAKLRVLSFLMESFK